MPEEPWRQLYRYWLSKQVEGRLPARRDIEPILEIPGLVANLMMLDIEPAGYRYRFVGSEVEARAKMNMTGRLIGIEGTPGPVVEQWRAALDRVAQTQKPQLYVSRLPDGVVAKYVTLLLPLADQAGRTEKILVGSFYDGYVEPGTRILGMWPVETELGGEPAPV